MKTFKNFISEGLFDKMKPKPEAEINYKLDKMWNELLNSYKEVYNKYWDDVYHFIAFKRMEIEELFLEGWSVQDVYDEYHYKIENYLDDLEDEEDDFHTSYN